ncbi:MAG: Asp23/Gls24 family envelope stress response protein [Brockia lithotrophica]|nr:Asp23/Gls24 family envelope stress response protein [Brockia lithotrophica]
MPMDTSDREHRSGEALSKGAGAPRSGDLPPRPDMPETPSNRVYSKESETKDHGVATEVISLLARLAVEDTPGAHPADEPYAGGRVYRLWGRLGGPAVQLRRDGGRFSAFVRLAVDYGADIRSVAREVQRRVREDVERFTGHVLDAVDVFVEEVRERKGRPPELPAAEAGRSEGARSEERDRSAGNSAEPGDRQGDADFSEAHHEGRSAVADEG